MMSTGLNGHRMSAMTVSRKALQKFLSLFTGTSSQMNSYVYELANQRQQNLLQTQNGEWGTFICPSEANSPFDARLLFESVEQLSTDNGMPLGVITACRVHELIKKEGQTVLSARYQYLLKLLNELKTGNPQRQLGFKHAWEQKQKPIARKLYQSIRECELEMPRFIYGDSRCRYGGFMEHITGHSGLTISCPWQSSHHLNFVSYGFVRPELITQCQFNMWITGVPEWELCSYDPRHLAHPLHMMTLFRDEEKMALFEKEIPRFLQEMTDACQSSLDMTTETKQ